MSSAQLFYAINLFIYAGVDIACLGLNQQFGVAAVTNFGFIIFQAASAYTAAILSLPNQSANGAFQSYIGGWNLPWPVPWIAAMIVRRLIAVPSVHVPGRAAAARRLRCGRTAGHRRHGEPARHQLPAAAERRRWALPGARAAAE
jgi:ABC-type branched-subunit amino acid transport system permease subunit